MLDDCTKRLAELRGLSDGWLDGHGKAPTEAAQAGMRTLLDRPEIRTCGLYPTMFPTEEGGLLLEARGARWDIGIEAAPDGTLSLYGVEIGGSGEIPEAAFGCDAGALSEAAAPYFV